MVIKMWSPNVASPFDLGIDVHNKTLTCNLWDEIHLNRSPVHMTRLKAGATLDRNGARNISYLSKGKFFHERLRAD